MRDKETLTIQVNNEKVEINHNWDKSSGRSFKLQENGLDEITSYIHNEIVNEKKEEGHVSYNNFESAFDWKILKAKPIQLELPFPGGL